MVPVDYKEMASDVAVGSLSTCQITAMSQAQTLPPESDRVSSASDQARDDTIAKYRLP
jgi:hypothetical protein